jgi:hypothetical protein
VHALWERWRSNGRSLTAPALLHYEIANGLYRCKPAAEVQQAPDAVLALPGELTSEAALPVEAFLLARRLQSVWRLAFSWIVVWVTSTMAFWTTSRCPRSSERRNPASSDALMPVKAIISV